MSGERLKHCYELVSDRVQRYLDAEIEFVREQIHPSFTILELGCGYGRVIQKLQSDTNSIIGIDTALASLQLAQKEIDDPVCRFIVMDALALGFADDQFDLVFCIQNGICAFGVDQMHLITEAIRVTKPGGKVLFSSYAEEFWPHRLLWFEQQAQQGLVGEIDYTATKKGTIVCKDGFISGTLFPTKFKELTSTLEFNYTIHSVDESSVFYEIGV